MAMNSSFTLSQPRLSMRPWRQNALAWRPLLRPTSPALLPLRGVLSCQCPTQCRTAYEPLWRSKRWVHSCNFLHSFVRVSIIVIVDREWKSAIFQVQRPFLFSSGVTVHGQSGVPVPGWTCAAHGRRARHFSFQTIQRGADPEYGPRGQRDR